MEITQKINRLQCVFVYQKNTEIRQRAFEFEKKLSPFFSNNPFTIMGIPDDIDPNIPRFQGRNRTDIISVSQIQATWGITLSKLNLDSLEGIVSKRIAAFKDLMIQEKINFAGIISDIDYIFEKPDDILDLFKTSTKSQFLENNNLRDYAIFYSLIYHEKFFLNIKCAKVGKIEQLVKINLSKKTEEVEKTGQYTCINVITDINSKALFNMGHPFDINHADELFNETMSILKRANLENYLKAEL